MHAGMGRCVILKGNHHEDVPGNSDVHQKVAFHGGTVVQAVPGDYWKGLLLMLHPLRSHLELLWQVPVCLQFLQGAGQKQVPLLCLNH